MRLILLLVLCLTCSSCSLLKKREAPAPLALATTKPLPPEKTGELLAESVSNWWHGPGLGRTALNVGTVALFPPYLFVIAGNAALTVGGYEPIGVSALLPEQGSKAWNTVYDGVTSMPGRVTAAVSDSEYVTDEMAQASLQKYLESEQLLEECGERNSKADLAYLSE